jgi:hypothetical protein
MASYKLAVWKSVEGISSQEAANVYHGLIDGNRHTKFDPDVYSFYVNLTAVYPELDLVPEEEFDSSPWAGAIEVSNAHVILEIEPDKVQTLRQLTLSLAGNHGLVCFDPQDVKVYLPRRLKKGD